MMKSNNVNKVIDSLQMGNRVLLDDGTNPYDGFVVSVDSDSITINIFVVNEDIKFHRDQIAEISRI